MEIFADESFQFLAMIALSVLIVVFVADMIGNMIAFNNRFLNALVTGLVFLVIFGAATYFIGDFYAPGLVALGALLVFCADLVSNALVFKSRFGNALLTALITVVTLGAISYYFMTAI